MKKLIILEEIMMFVLGIFLFQQLGYVWWLFLVLLFVPDLSMIGYFVNTHIGAVIYNFFHHRALHILIYIVGAMMNMNSIMLAGVILFSHSSLDRTVGYGFKYKDAFKHTHLSEAE